MIHVRHFTVTAGYQFGWLLPVNYRNSGYSGQLVLSNLAADTWFTLTIAMSLEEVLDEF